MNDILVTGFEPFAGDTVNPSMELALALDGVVVGGCRIAGRVLPCAFDAARPALDAALDATRPALVFALGQGGGRCDLSFERVALNLVDARIADNDGAQPIDEAVIAGAPAAHFATLPLKAIVAALRERGVPASLSLSAGSFVCNAVFYALLDRLARDAAWHGTRAGFVHLPLLPEQAARRATGQPCLPLATMADGLRAAIATALERSADLRIAGGTLD
jgi:pyroglutamyl-peptidase